MTYARGVVLALYAGFGSGLIGGALLWFGLEHDGGGGLVSGGAVMLACGVLLTLLAGFLGLFDRKTRLLGLLVLVVVGGAVAYAVAVAQGLFMLLMYFLSLFLH